LQVCNTEALRELKSDETVQAWGAKDFKSNQAKDKLRANMGQCQPKERGFKQGFKEGFRSKVLKNCKEQGLKESR
jgi:hypothetical protein